ncbi:MAG: hypothetical protein J6D03_01130 [Clostridia bacterium]|nr:hypothetical protein [Clostridia bacterium]
MAMYLNKLTPKHKVGDRVSFEMKDGTIEGNIVVVDKGTFEDPYNVYYDIEGEAPGTNHEIWWFKHIPETDVTLIREI